MFFLVNCVTSRILVSELPIFVGETFFLVKWVKSHILVSELPIFVGEIHVFFSGEMCEITHFGE